MAQAIPIIKIALTAYSAVSAVKALSEGNIMGAVMGGFGAYMGLNSLGAFDAATAGDALAQSAAQEGTTSQAQMLAEQTGEFGLAGEAATADALGVLEASKLGEAGANVMAKYDTAAMNLPGAGIKEIGTPIDVGASVKNVGFMDSISSGWDKLISSGEAIIDNLTGDLISSKDGSILAKAGEALTGDTGNMLMKGVGMATDYYGKKQAIEAQEKAADKTYARAQQEAQRARSSVGSAPSYVYDFGGRREAVV